MPTTKTKSTRRSVMIHMDMPLFERFERAHFEVMPEVDEWMSAFGRQLLKDSLDRFESKHATRTK